MKQLIFGWDSEAPIYAQYTLLISPHCVRHVPYAIRYPRHLDNPSEELPFKAVQSYRLAGQETVSSKTWLHLPPSTLTPRNSPATT